MRPLRLASFFTAALVLAITSAAGAQDIDIVLKQFGVGSAYRPGEETGIQLELTSHLAEPMQVWVQWGVPNADGDIQEAGRSLALTPGRATPVWLYAPLTPPPREVTNASIWTVRVYEERDGVRHSELAATRISPALAGASPVQIESSMIAVIGTSAMGLEDYDVAAPSGLARPVSALEPTRLVRGITPAQLPDRWYGLKGFEAIAWSNADPQQLRADQATALKQYVQHGGHLIIDLPQVGDPWSLGITGRNELDDVLPARALNTVPRRDDAVPLSLMLPIMSKSGSLPRDIEMSIRVFQQIGGSFDALDNYYRPLIALPDGRVIVVQRTFGDGHITVIGVELSQQLTSMGLPHADVFWNRILGRRYDTPTLAEAMALEKDKRLTNGAITEVIAGSGIAVEQTIALSGEASRALLLALFLFGAYWLLAGPLGFAILRKQKMAQHSWVAFLVATAVFTAIAWGSVSLLRTDKVGVKHVTFLDYIARPDGDRGDADPQYARAVSWLSVYLNKYGPVKVGLVPTPDQRNMLLSWPAPRRENQPFPNIDRYQVDVGRDPTVFAIPARSTTTQLYANWLGPLDRNWGGMITPSLENPIKVNVINNREDSLSGTLQHSFDGALTNVIIIWIQNNRIAPPHYAMDGDKEQPWVSRTTSGDMLNVGRAWIIPSWDPSTPFDLNQQLFNAAQSGGRGSAATNLQLYLDQRYISPYKTDNTIGGFNTNPSPNETRVFFEMLSMYDQLTPPEYISDKDRTSNPMVVIKRDIGRELDLSTWFNGPCLIVIGRLENSVTPLPLLIEGVKPETSGLTIVRWIYPLPINERIAFPDVFRQDNGPKPEVAP